ncbi:MAG TPA: cytidylate kinase-like family protein [Terracidiphilus sp.]|nr:cytidylate kinase-like family protein [Terracidiphilus sp.]
MANWILPSDGDFVVFSLRGGLNAMMHTPTRIITVEREYGSRGGEFAHDLAERLGWKLLDSELVSGAARAAGVSPELAAQFDERLDPWYYRYGKVFWHDSAYPMTGLGDDQVFDSERMLTLIRQEILDAAEQGNCVLVGRGAACALACHPGCFHVFVYATSKAKREWFQGAFPKQAQHADQLLAAFDKRRAAVIRKFYEQDWCARGLYHMLLNSAIGFEGMIEAVQGAAGLVSDEPLSTGRSMGPVGETC